MTTDTNLRQFTDRLGKVASQPVSVASYTNKRMTINFRAPLERLRRLVPECIEVEEIGDTGMGMISQCVCDFHVTRFGALPIPSTHTNEMLCRISVRLRKGGQTYRAYYTLRSDTSSHLLGVLGGRFSHFRKAISDFTLKDDGVVYKLTCRAQDARCNGYFSADLGSLSLQKPDTSCFADIEAATQFVFQLDGSCGYDFGSQRLSFQKIEYPQWDLRFCHNYEYKFALLDEIFERYDLQPEFDCVLFMEKVPQVWGSAWLYAQETHIDPLTAAGARAVKG